MAAQAEERVQMSVRGGERRRWSGATGLSSLLMAAFVAVMALAAAQPAAAQNTQDSSGCSVERLQRMIAPSARVLSAVWKSAAGGVPAHCAVTGYIQHDGKLGFALGLPETWNHKFLFIGTGAFAGAPGDLTPGLRRGYATASTDTGHADRDSMNASWAIGDLAAVRNHFETSIALVPPAMKQVAAIYYGAAPAYAYWDGCSGGGRQGLMTAQRYPDMFDGIIAGAPAWNYTKLFIGFIEHTKLITRSPDNWIPAEIFDAIDREVLRQCDPLDGVVDGLVDDPRVCHPNLSALRCKPKAAAASCLTDAQLAVLEEIQHPRFATPGSGYYGYLLSGADAPQLGWSRFIFGDHPEAGQPGKPVVSPAARLGVGFLRDMIKQDHNYDWRAFSAKADGPALERAWGSLTNADSTDLSRYVRGGGKVIIWHGWADPAIPAQMSIDLYSRIQRDTKGPLVPPTDESVRLFMAPGFQHCRGGTGFTEFDRLTALEDWVEQGRAPASIIATQLVDGQPRRTRPLCAYPKTARYTGRGSQDDAANFVCR
ncbi:MAG: tannase/feruloyl esterase family alpha/beta hydrolase [Phenylobacterium sp.]